MDRLTGGRLARTGDRNAAPPLCRHARTCSTAVRFNFCGRGERLEYERVSGGSRGSKSSDFGTPASPVAVPGLAPASSTVMPGLVPGIHAVRHRGASRARARRRRDVDARNKSIAVRFNSFGRGKRLEYERVSGGSRGSRLGFRYAGVSRRRPRPRPRPASTHAEDVDARNKSGHDDREARSAEGRPHPAKIPRTLPAASSSTGAMRSRSSSVTQSAMPVL